MRAGGEAAAGAERQAAGDAPEADVQAREAHVGALRRVVLLQVPLVQSHAFRSAAASTQHSTSSNRARDKAIMKQVRPSPARPRRAVEPLPACPGLSDARAHARAHVRCGRPPCSLLHAWASQAPESGPCMQLTSLSASLPAHWESSVHVAVDCDRVDVARVLILAAPDTPYAHGAFLFDVFFPHAFPNVPPMVRACPHPLQESA